MRRVRARWLHSSLHLRAHIANFLVVRFYFYFYFGFICSTFIPDAISGSPLSSSLRQNMLGKARIGDANKYENDKTP